MSLLALIIIFSLIGGMLSVFVASVVLLLTDHQRDRLIPHLISFAIGALLSAAFLALLPHAILHPAVTDVHNITFTVLLGILAFFMLEKFVLWRHCHTATCEAHGTETEITHEHHERSAAMFVLVGDSLHNLVDGVLIGAAFLTDEHLGIVTALAVAAHEIPQELGDFVVLLKGGFSRKRALMFNILTSLTTLIGALASYYALQGFDHILPYVLAIAASCFIYVAVADLIPSLHKRVQLKVTMQQLLLIAAGVTVIYLSHSTLH